MQATYDESLRALEGSRVSSKCPSWVQGSRWENQMGIVFPQREIIDLHFRLNDLLHDPPNICLLAHALHTPMLKRLVNCSEATVYTLFSVFEVRVDIACAPNQITGNFTNFSP